MENQYMKQYPDIMWGKKIMYVHGFASSACSGTVGRMRTMLPSATVVAEDIPIDPHEGLAMLREMAEREKPDLIIGTSMGGMYAEQLHGFDRILINPAFRIADTMGAHGMTGRQTFLNSRKDGVQEFIVTKTLVKEYRNVQEGCFADTSDVEQRHVWGLFGDEDQLVQTYPLFSEHYRRAVWFHGGHRMNDEVFVNSVIPVIRWIDDCQEVRDRKVIYISIDALRDKYGKQLSSARKTFRRLLDTYEIFFVAPSPNHDAGQCADVLSWLKENIGVPAYDHVVFVNRPQLLLGDFLITPQYDTLRSAFMGTVVSLGSPTFKTWDEIANYFERLGGGV
ncbi:YqiA/YcfP family alpha/beta fold hydrolase [Prevotella sp. OH937_COT-195]|uniref:YqiA/YcfP family alpha/beta fold hydrolase n=1 Tax=Prevotella sp. OH937_COT-195 TaxID=2491051 RepID=UPI000F6468E2|nr:YqiA/YcfP family alpha/beta fold hydrolase [Prevotella sp. OH937_COT-195]RRD02558.1 esterase [Prevotella sp. OH937_COT-195]